ncbi:MAG: hypothetical protein LBV74_10595 [Tannerella sp.]|jgi:hypothetical protein|nr:hypothetical protein [Tannerella sp.]
MPSEGNKQIIPLGEYEHLCEIGVAFEGIVELENGLLLYVYCETAVIGHFENKHHISYGTTTKSYEVPVCPQDNTRVNIQGQELPIQSKSSKYYVERKVRDELLKKLSDFTNGKSRRPVNERLTEADKFYGSLHDKIENGTIKKSDFDRGRNDQSLKHALRKEIDVYFLCFDPTNPGYKSFWGIYESPFGCAEDWIPVWGQAKLAAESLNTGLNGYGAGHYFYAVGYFLLGVADLGSFGMESAIAKGLNSAGKTISGVLSRKVINQEAYYAYRYITEGELSAIRNTNLLRGGRSGETYFTKDLYKSGVKAQSRLALPTTPTIRIEFEIVNNPKLINNGTKVLPAYNQAGKGAEFMTLDIVEIKLINWQPLR